MTTPNSSCPHVYRAISRITADFAKAGIAKAHTNLHEQYQYRSIDDLLNRLAPLLAKHRLCVLPQVLKRQAKDRTGEAGEILVNVRVLVAFELVSCRDGSKHLVKAWGEALDPGDKGTAKAMSAAYKGAMLQAFCVPVPQEDPDASSRRLRREDHEPRPVEGWDQWTEGVLDIVASCESTEALHRVRDRQRALLTAISRERPELYVKIGTAVNRRTAQLTKRAAGQPATSRTKKLDGRRSISGSKEATDVQSAITTAG